MALIKDGNVYRTLEEQVTHLTKKHQEQNIINQNVSRTLSDLQVVSNLGGYNYVRFAFEKQGIYYRISNNISGNIIKGSEVNDYFEITSQTSIDIPAYGYLRENGFIELEFTGDFSAQYKNILIRNVTKNKTSIVTPEYEEFTGTSLLDYNPNSVKKQMFNVIEDLSYGTKTQYASFDFNNDGIYNYVFIGAIQEGSNGSGMFVTDGDNISSVIQTMKVGDLLLFTGEGIIFGQPAKIGDVFRYVTSYNFVKEGNIRGEKGETGTTGQKGEQGIQGVQGEQGIQGLEGPQGEKGKDGMSLRIFTGIYDNEGQLPLFSTAEVGDAYRVRSMNDGIETITLHFKAVNGTTWDKQANWGGIEGPQGLRGPTGLQGVQGIQGPQGEQGIPGPQGPAGINSIRLYLENNTSILKNIDIPKCNILYAYGGRDNNSILYISSEGQTNNHYFYIYPQTTVMFLFYEDKLTYFQLTTKQYGTFENVTNFSFKGKFNIIYL